MSVPAARAGAVEGPDLSAAPASHAGAIGGPDPAAARAYHAGPMREPEPSGAPASHPGGIGGSEGSTAPAITVATTDVCAPLGFSAGAAAAGIRGDGDATRLDLALLRSDRPCSAAGVFTRNTVKAAPVAISQLTLRRGNRLQALVANAGNANACTGVQGFRDALVMCSTAADALDLDPSQVLVCSTGVIGRPMPMDLVTAGIRAAASVLSPEGGGAAARAIMTTDTRPKSAGAAFTLDGRTLTVGGIAKGAGMIHRDMASLLVFVTTDAPASPALLQPLLTR
ncbi:MAG: bifunctional ornithine acetyltransferase/N-acetylglutamate synthase, partial [Candidatus Dormibacteria bacterium]